MPEPEPLPGQDIRTGTQDQDRDPVLGQGPGISTLTMIRTLTRIRTKPKSVDKTPKVSRGLEAISQPRAVSW